MSHYDEVTKNYDLLDWFIAFDLRYKAYCYALEIQKENISEIYNKYIKELRNELEQDWKNEPEGMSLIDYIDLGLPSKVDFIISNYPFDPREHEIFLKCGKSIINKGIFNTKEQSDYSIYDSY